MPPTQDPERPVANLPIINYEELLLQKPEEIEKLYLACDDWGYFYLDLSGDKTKDYLNNVDSLLTASKEYFAKPHEEKLEDQNICGYKPMGFIELDTGPLKDSEDLRVPFDVIHNPTFHPGLYFPRGIQTHEQQFASFLKDSHSMANLILKNLSDYLHLEGDNRFENFHKPNEPSTSSAVLQHTENRLSPQIMAGHFTYTYAGSMTVLFNTDWALQILSPETHAWEYVPPRKNYAIINVGDTLSDLSHFQLKPRLHRVFPLLARDSSFSRYDTIFFLCATENEVKFRDSERVMWTGSVFRHR